jgi:hypothetical protein
MDIVEMYFRPKRWESSGRIYKLVGVLLFKRIVVRLGKSTGQNSSKPNNYYIWQRNVEGLRKFEQKTRYNELMHLAGIIIPLIGLISKHVEPSTRIILWLVLLINIHPFFLQRYNRGRIYKILENHKS